MNLRICLPNFWVQESGLKVRKVRTRYEIEVVSAVPRFYFILEGMCNRNSGEISQDPGRKFILARVPLKNKERFLLEGTNRSLDVSLTLRFSL